MGNKRSTRLTRMEEPLHETVVARAVRLRKQSMEATPLSTAAPALAALAPAVHFPPAWLPGDLKVLGRACGVPEHDLLQLDQPAPIHRVADLLD